MENPFRFGGELNQDELVDRQDELQQVIETIRTGEKLFLIGPRRYGKTSILHAASQVCRTQGVTVLRYNCEAFPSLRDLTERIFRDATAALISPTAKVTTTMRGLFTRLKPEISVNLLEQTVSASIGVNEEGNAAEIPLLIDALHGIEALARKSKQPFGIILDEFQHIIELGGETAERQLRAAVQEHRKIGYVFAGSKTRMLAEMVSDHGRPFYRLGSRRFLGIVPRVEFIPWLVAQFGKGRFTATEENLTLLLNAAEDVPYDIQRLAHTCWSVMTGQNLKKLTPEVIAQACQMLIEQNNPLYTMTWNQLTSNQQNILLQIRPEQGTGLTTKRVSRQTGIATTTIQKTLDALRDKGILFTEELPGKIKWRFEDPFFGMWIHYITTGELLVVS